VRNLGLAALVLVLLLLGASRFPLQEPDEGRYATIAQHVARTGDLVALELDGIAYLEKPPLFFWLAAASMRALGETELAARLPSVLASAFTVLLVAHWAARRASRGRGLLAAAVLLSLPLFAFFARVAIVDLVLLACVTSSLYAAWRALEAGTTPRRWVNVFWVALGLASLVKGPVGVVLPVASVLAFVALTRDRRAFFAFARPDGLLLFALVSVPWFALASRRNPAFLFEFFVSQNLGRLTTGGRFNRDHPFTYYLPILAVAFLPWTIFLGEIVASIRAALRDRHAEGARLRLFLACAVVVPLAILSVAHSKLPYYLLPIAPPVALLVADALGSRWGADPRAGRWRLLGIGVGAFGLAAAALAAERAGVSHVPGWRWDERRALAVAAILPWVELLLVGVGVTGVVASLLAARGRAQAGAVAIGMAIAVAFALARFTAASAETIFTARPVFDAVSRLRRPGEPVLMFRAYLRGLPFYLGEPAILSEARYDEFGHDVSLEEAHGFALQENQELTKALLDGPRSVLVVADGPHRLEEIRVLYTKKLVELEAVGPFLILRAGGS
jgi:4-amino-4-deoxy-L-arabinose transferase-like glycosyltransferase